MESTLEGCPDKHITRKKWQMDNLDSVFPSMSGLVERQQSFESLVRQDLAHGLLVLVFRIKCVPR
jgi:hypothetical protein